MSKRRTRRMAQRDYAQSGAIVAASAAEPRAVEAFTFGDPEPVLDRRVLLDMAECWHNGRWYEPPISRDGLARAFRVSAHHSSAILLKRNRLVASIAPTPFMSHGCFSRMALDYLVFGDCYAQRVLNRLGGLLRLDHAPAKFTRRGVEPGTFYYVPGDRPEAEFPPGTVLQVMQPDVNQEIYGVPEYLSALQSALLNEAATLFRRRYYLNGSHAGFIMYATGQFAEGDIDKMREALRQSKGPGNFRNLFMHAPNGSEHGIKILPIAEVGAKDEFLGIKSATQADVLTAHRVPPQLLGIVPAQGSAFGNPDEAKATFYELEIDPLLDVFLEMNAMLGVEAVRLSAATLARRERAAAPPA